MANLSESITLKQLVKGLLFKEGKNNDDYLRYLQIACDGIRDMHVHDFQVAVTRVVTVDADTKTFSYPDDYVKYEFIATVQNGRWWTYTKDKTLAPLNDDFGTAIQSSIPATSDGVVSHGLTDGGGSNYYYFTEDNKNRRFLVGGFDADVVVLKYISNGLDSSGDITIQGYTKLALESFIRWQLSYYNNDPISQQSMKKAIYEENRRKMRRVNMGTVEDVYDVIYRTTGQGVRR